MADIARIEERLDRVAAGNTAVSDQLGGIVFQNMTEVMEFSKLMSMSGNAVPKHLQGNPGMCLAVCIQALEWRFSPFAVANKSYEVQGRLCFESQLVHALIEQRAPIRGRLQHRFEGEGDERKCIVWATLRDTGETMEYTSSAISKITPKNSPLWKTKPDLQLYYNASRDFCRAYFPDVLLGVYSQDELRDHVGPDHAKDVTKPDVASRLKGGKGRGFSANHVERETRGVIETTEYPEGASGTAREASSAGSGDAEVQSTSGTQSAPPSESNSSLQVSSPGASETDKLASDPSPSPLAVSDAGNNSESSEGSLADDDAQAGAGSDKPSAGLPQGWEVTYIAALKRARKKDSLPKYAQEYWNQYGGWLAHRDTADGEVASAIYNAFFDHFNDEAGREAVLREIVGNAT